MGDGVRESGFFEMTSALGGPTGTTVIVKEPTERRLWDARAIVAKRSGGVMKNRQVKVTKVTRASPFGTWGSQRAYATLIARDPDHVNRTVNPRSN